MKNVDEFTELPSLVIDLKSLYGGNEVDIAKLDFIMDVWDDFNVYVWEDVDVGVLSAIKNIIYTDRLREELVSLYEMDFVAFKRCSGDKLRRFLKFKRTVILSEREEVAREFGRFSVNCFDGREVRMCFEYWRRV